MNDKGKIFVPCDETCDKSISEEFIGANPQKEKQLSPLSNVIEYIKSINQIILVILHQMILKASWYFDIRPNRKKQGVPDQFRYFAEAINQITVRNVLTNVNRTTHVGPRSPLLLRPSLEKGIVEPESLRSLRCC